MKRRQFIKLIGGTIAGCCARAAINLKTAKALGLDVPPRFSPAPTR